MPGANGLQAVFLGARQGGRHKEWINLKLRCDSRTAKKLLQSLASDWQIYVLLLPVVIWFALWAYKPMGGLLIAFKRFDSSLGVWNSDFKGIANFMTLVSGVYQTQFWQAFRNTFVINAYSLVFGFPVPIILAILFAEIGNSFCPEIDPDGDLSAPLFV